MKSAATRDPSRQIWWRIVPTCSRASVSNSCPPKAKVTRSDRVGCATSEQIWALAAAAAPDITKRSRTSTSRMAQMLENTGAAALQFYACGTGGAEFRRACHQGAERGFPRLLRSMSGVEAVPKV